MVPGVDVCLFLPVSFPISRRIEKNIACAPEYFSILPRALKSLLTDLGLRVETSLVLM